MNVSLKNTQSIMADKDLDFLYQCSNEQLKLLADFMLYDKDGKLRWAEEISSTQAFKLK